MKQQNITNKEGCATCKNNRFFFYNNKNVYFKVYTRVNKNRIDAHKRVILEKYGK